MGTHAKARHRLWQISGKPTAAESAMRRNAGRNDLETVIADPDDDRTRSR
jgi:hypothetical protein